MKGIIIKRSLIASAVCIFFFACTGSNSPSYIPVLNHPDWKSEGLQNSSGYTTCIYDLKNSEIIATVVFIKMDPLAKIRYTLFPSLIGTDFANGMDSGASKSEKDPEIINNQKIGSRTYSIVKSKRIAEGARSYFQSYLTLSKGLFISVSFVAYGDDSQKQIAQKELLIVAAINSLDVVEESKVPGK